MKTHRNNNVSIMLLYQTALLCAGQFTLIMNQPCVCTTWPIWHWREIPCNNSSRTEAKSRWSHCRDGLCMYFHKLRKFYVSTFQWLQPTSQVTVTSSGRTVKRRFHQLDDDPDQEVPEYFHVNHWSGICEKKILTVLLLQQTYMHTRSKLMIWLNTVCVEYIIGVLYYRCAHFGSKPRLMFKDEAGDILYFSFCQQLSLKEQKWIHSTNKHCLCSKPE